MCPSADRTKTLLDNSATFFMTNMIPQSPDNNQGIWANLEDYSRSLVYSGYDLFVISGAYGVGGTGSNGYATALQGGKIRVPNRTWKIIVVLDAAAVEAANNNALGVVTNTTRVIAVDIPNTQGVRRDDWRDYRVSVDYLEGQTGYDFLSKLPVGLQAVLEAQVDTFIETPSPPYPKPPPRVLSPPNPKPPPRVLSPPNPKPPPV
jgi:endonuclease G